MVYLCECRGPCRRRFELHLDAYAYMRSMGAVVTLECAEREGRTVFHRHRSAGVAAVATLGSRPRRHRPAHPSASL